MNFKDQDKPAADPAEEANVEAALRHFRASIHGWSEQEFARPRVLHRSPWSRVLRALANPAVAWTMAAILAAGSAGVPAAVHREHQAEAARQAALALQQQQAAEQAARQAAANVDDETLLSGIDSDIAQAAPNAMQPLASLMSDTETNAPATR